MDGSSISIPELLPQFAGYFVHIAEKIVGRIYFSWEAKVNCSVAKLFVQFSNKEENDERIMTD